MNARELALIDARTERLITENADLRALLRDIADYTDAWAYTDEELSQAAPGTLEHLMYRVLTAVRNREQGCAHTSRVYMDSDTQEYRCMQCHAVVGA